MNKVFKVIWNEARNAYVVVSEIAKNRGSKSCSTKKLLAMLIAMGVMTCASFDVLAAPPSVAATAKSQYVAFFDETAGLINGQEDTIDGHKYIYDATNKYWVRAGYKLTVEENGKLHTPLSAHGKAADVAYIGDGDTGSILQSVTSMVSASGTVTNMGESLSRITASAFAGVSHGGGAAVAGDWSYIIQDSSWQGYENYQDGYVDLIDQANGMPKGFVTVGEKLKWDDTKQAYTYNGKPVDYSNVYVIDGKIGVFTNQSGSDFYKGTVFGKNNEILMTVKGGDHFYSYWAAEVTDPSATMQSYRLAEYKKDLAVLVENDNKLSRDDIKEVTLDTSKANSATISLLRNGDKAVDGAITVTSGGGTEGSDTFVKISNGTANQTFATGSKVEAIGTTEATTGIKINGQEYTIKSGSVVSVAKDAANKTTTITVDGNATTITDTDTTYTAGDGIKINVGAISVSKNLTGMQSIQGAGEGKISFDGANVKVNNTTFSENSVVVGGGTDGKTPVTINGTDGVVSGLHNTNIGYTDFATRGNAATEEQLKKVMDAGWKFTTDSNEKTTVKVGPDGTNDNAVTFKGDGTNIAVTNTGKDIKVALKKDLTVDSVKAGDFFMDKNKGVGYVDKAYITSSGLNANNQKITGVADGNNDTDAVNFGQLKKVSNNLVNVDFTNISDNGKTEIVNIAKAADVHVKEGKYSVQADGTVTMTYVDGNGHEVTGKELKITDVASATKLNALNNTVTNIDGRVTTNSTNITTLQGEVITSGSIGANGKVELTKDNGSKVEVGTVKDYSVTSGTYDQTTKKLTLTKTDAYGNATSGTVDIDLSGIQSGDKNWTAQANGTDVKPNADNKVNFINGDNTNVTTSGDGVIAVNLSTALTGIQSITGVGGTINLAGSAITINETTFNKDGRIQNVAAGTETKDAVNFGQLDATNKKVDNLTTEVGKGWTVATDNGTATKVGAGDTVKFSGADNNIKLSNDGTNVKVELNKELKGLTSVTTKNAYVTEVNEGDKTSVTNVKFVEDKIAGVTLTEGNGISITDKKINVKLKDGEKNLVVDSNGLSLNTALTGIESITGAGAGSISFADGGIKLNNKVTIDNNGKITGVADGTDDTDAVNVGQLNAVKAEASKKTTLSNGKNTTVTSVTTDGQTDYKVNVAGDLKDITSVANGASEIKLNADSIIIANTNKTFAITNSGIGMSYVASDYSTKAIMLGENGTTISGGLDVAGSKITGVAAGEANTDAVNVGHLNTVKNELQTSDKQLVTNPASTDGSYKPDANGNISLRVEDQNKNGYNVVIKDVASKAELSEVANRVTNVENKVTQIETDVTNIKNDITNIQTDVTDIKTDITNINNRVDKVEALAGKHTTLENGTNINVEETLVDGHKNYKVNLNKDITLGDENGNKVSISGTNGTITATGDITTANRINADKGGKLADIDVTGNKLSNGSSSITLDGTNVKVNDKVTVDKDGKISGVAKGDISNTSTDAVNGSQLYDTNTHITNVENQVISNSNRIGQLSSRVNKVGAGAAALAALHPMDFDPDDKLTFSAGYGNYAGENAAAIGAYYRPDEKVMFSVAGTVGNGENMVNAGVSFALDRTNHVSNSRTALAREVIDLRGQLAVMGAKMAKMEKAFGMLDETKTKLFPDVPANHWAYEYIAKLAGNGYIEGYPDGNFGGDRLMTRYEFAAMLYRAIENGAALEEKIIKEFEPELGRIRVDRISGEDGDRDKIERVRVNDTKGERDHYGNKLAK